MAQLDIPLVNKTEYDFTQIRAVIAGITVIGIQEITYSEDQEKTNEKGAQDRPVSRGHGAIEANASISLLMTEIERIRDNAPNGSLLRIPAFDIQVVYQNEGRVVSHTLKNCEFISDSGGGNEGDTGIAGSFDLVISHVEWRP